MTLCKKDSDLKDAVCIVLFFKVKGSEHNHISQVIPGLSFGWSSLAVALGPSHLVVPSLPSHDPSLIASQVRAELPAFEKPPTVGRQMTSQWDASAALNPMRKLQVRISSSLQERDHFLMIQVWEGASAASFPSHLPGVL